MGYYSLVRDVGNAVRLAEVIRVLARHGFADMLRRMGVHEGAPAKILRSLHLLNPPEGEPDTLASRLRAALTELGPTFVKVGQILSTRPDVVGVTLSADLQDLQDRVSARPFEDIQPIIEESLEGSLSELYREFDTTPIAAASLSQVYRAVLHSGETVAVKVQRPGMRHVIDSDMKLLRGIAKWVELHVDEFAWIEPVALVDEFHRTLLRELNFSIEGQVIEAFRENFKDNDSVFIPKVYFELSSERVLTMDFIDGIRIDALEQYEERNSHPETVARLGCETIFDQIFEHRIFHADPHPGNIFVTRDDQIAFLDFGMIGALEKADTFLMAEALKAIFERNTADCVRCFLTFTVSGEAEDAHGLERDIGEFIAFEAQHIVREGLVSQAIERLITILHRHRLQLAARFSLLMKALVTIESTAHALDGNLNTVPIIRPYIEKTVAARYSPSAIMHEAREDAMRTLRFGRQAPQEIQQILRMVRRGRLKFQVTHERLDRLANIIDRASNRLTFGLIAGSLIVGSSLLVSSDSSAAKLGVAGYSIAGLLGLALLISILRSRNF